MLGVWLCATALAVHSAVGALDANGAGWRLFVIVLALLGTGAFAVWQWRHSPQGLLRWDGEAWWWQPRDEGDHAGTAVIRLDLQQILLVQWFDSVDHRRVWLWLDAGAVDNRANWHLFRCALHAKPKPAPQMQADERGPSTAASAGIVS